MACPHVSGVVALGLSYAAKLHRHVKAEVIRELLHSTSRPIESFWDMDSPKLFYKFVADLSDVHLSSMDLRNYRGQMGEGQVDAYAFLQAVAGAGVEMTFPNVFVAVNGTVTLIPSMYFEGGEGQTYSVSVENQELVSCDAVGNKLVFRGIAPGQTKAVVSSGNGASASFVITVRDTANGNGWL